MRVPVPAAAVLSTLLVSPMDWGFAAMLVGVVALVRVAGDLVAWNRERSSSDH